MKWLLWVSLLLNYPPESRQSCLSQPNEVIWRKKGQSVILSCTVSSNCSAEDWQFEWFTFKESDHFRIKPRENPEKYMPLGAYLYIASLHANDSGIYHCAAFHGGTAPGAQHIGPGTTLVVKAKAKVMVRNILLWLCFALLAVYSLAIVTLIITKYGSKTSVCSKRRKLDKSSTKKRQFHDVLQEMYGRKDLERGKQPVCRVAPHKATSADLNGSAEDIYQNI